MDRCELQGVPSGAHPTPVLCAGNWLDTYVPAVFLDPEQSGHVSRHLCFTSDVKKKTVMLDRPICDKIAMLNWLNITIICSPHPHFTVLHFEGVILRESKCFLTHSFYPHTFSAVHLHQAITRCPSAAWLIS